MVYAVEFNKYPTDDAYQKAKEAIMRQVQLTDEEVLSIDNNHYCETKDQGSFLNSGKKLAEIYCQKKDDFALSNLIGGALRFEFDKNGWTIIKDWAEHAVQFKDNALNNATLAMVYKKLKNKEMALSFIDKALSNCKRDNETYGERIELFKEIENANYN